MYSNVFGNYCLQNSALKLSKSAKFKKKTKQYVMSNYPDIIFSQFFELYMYNLQIFKTYNKVHSNVQN